MSKKSSPHSLLLPLIHHPDAQKIIAALGKDTTRFVGGCVRNALWGLPSDDIDFATTHLPHDTVRILHHAGIKTVPTGIDHGTITAILSGVGYQITTLRHDIATDGRRAVVRFGTDWAMDAARRDFTINALYADADGIVYDPLGHGMDDLTHDHVRFIGSPAARIEEDYLRILRFFRFSARYGRGQPDTETVSVCARYATSLARLSRERITQEFQKIIMEPTAAAVLSTMHDAGILQVIIGGRMSIDAVARLIAFERKNKITHAESYALRLYALKNFRRFPVDKGLGKIMLTHHQKTFFTSMMDAFPKTRAMDSMNKMTLTKLLYFYPRPVVEAAMIARAITSEISPIVFQKIWKTAQAITIPVFPMTGKDIMAQGRTQGVEIGNTLKFLENQWIRSGFKATKEMLISRI